MPDRRPFRFGLQVRSTPDAASWRDLARQAEDTGYSVLTMPDHFNTQFAPAPALAIAAAATTRLRLGTLVLGNDYRHPVTCAKEAATLDVLSEGRLELGIGAGWTRDEYERSGIPFAPAGERLARLAETVQIVKGLFGPTPFTFEGTHYVVHDLDGHPKPLQQPHPPIVMGGAGRRMLELAAREADIVHVALRAEPDGSVDYTSITAEAVAEQIGWIGQVAGARLTPPEIGIYVWFVEITDDPRATAQALVSAAFATPESLLATPHALIGSVEHIVETLQARREQLGVSYITVLQDKLETLAPVIARLAGT